MKRIRTGFKEIMLLGMCLCLCLCLCLPLQAQTVLKGKVMDGSKNVPLPYATVALLSADSTVLTGTVTEEDGTFRFVVNTGNGRFLSFSFVGYTTVYTPLAPNQAVEIRLMPDVKQLSSVKVTAAAPIVEQQMDKLVMNVSQSAFAQGNNAKDLLRKAPGVSIDKDGNVKLNGQKVSVWMDGRPTQLDGKSLEALLKSTDGSSIDRIEVIANPSAKYDAEGQGGIIDIRTKRNFRKGLNGSLSADGGAMVFFRKMEMMDDAYSLFWDQNSSLNLNYRTAKSNTYLQLSEGLERAGLDGSTVTDLNASGTDFYQKILSRYVSYSKTAALKLGNDWFINGKNTLGVIFSLPFDHSRQWADTNENRCYQMQGGKVVQQVVTDAEAEYRFVQYMGNVNYTHVFSEERQSELTANFDYMHSGDRSDNPIDNYYLKPTEMLLWRPADLLSAERMSLKADRRVDVYSAKADWQCMPKKECQVEAGAKWALSRTDNDMEALRQDLLHAERPVGDRTYYDYSEHIAAMYATFSGQCGEHWSVKGGLRGEYTHAGNSARTVRQNYLNLFPSFFAGYNTSDMRRRFGFSYTRRIQRPEYDQLSPFPWYEDAHTTTVGNPELKPALYHDLYLTAVFGSYVTFSAFCMHGDDVISFTPQIDPATGDQTLYSDNIGSNTLAGGDLTLSELPLGKKLDLMLSVQLFNYWGKAASSVAPMMGETGENPSDELCYLACSGYGCLSWRLPGEWKLQLDGYLSSPMVMGYLHTDWKYVFNLAVKKTALDGRLQLSFGVDDLLRSEGEIFSMMVNGSELSRYDQRFLMQRVKFGLQWNFGTAQKPLRERNVGTFDESSRLGGGKGLR